MQPSLDNKVKNLFIGENEDRASVMNQFRDYFDSKYLLDGVFKNAQNNKVGYYLFRDQSSYFRIFFLPKHISIPTEWDINSEKDAIKHFLKYIGLHYHLQNTYKNYKNQTVVGDTLLEYSFESRDNPYCGHDDIEEFSFLRLETFLKNIETFFKTHKSVKRKSVFYTSQTIRHHFDLKSNIKEPNKTKIHQIKYEDVVYSEIANITYGAIRLFINGKVPIIKNEKAREKLLKHTQRILYLLKHNFKADDGKWLTPYMLVSRKVQKHFKKKRTFMQLYINILSLFGFENFFEDEIDADLNREARSEAFFLDPALLYEWYVYDSILKIPEFSNDEKSGERYIVSMDKDHGTSKSYIVKNTKFHKNESVSSNPDILILDTRNQHLFVLDVKWKLASSSVPKLDDILKLKRDCTIRGTSHTVHAVLVYPQVEDNLFEEYLYGDVPTFSFYTRRFPIDIESTHFDISALNTPAIHSSLDTEIQNLISSPRLLAEELEESGIDEDIIQETIERQLIRNVKELHTKIESWNVFTPEEILNSEYCRPIKLFLESHKMDLQEECREFIYSSVSAMFYFGRNRTQRYDYSLPASGLWKSIEVELNASVIFLLRYKSGVCSPKDYTKILDGAYDVIISTGKKTYQAVQLSKRNKKDPDKLDNIMLGSFPHMFKNIYSHSFDHRKMEQTFTPFCPENLSVREWSKQIADFLFRLLSVRNPHTHKELMEKEGFDAFLKDIFENSTFNFYDLIQLKKSILDAVANESSSAST